MRHRRRALAVPGPLCWIGRRQPRSAAAAVLVAGVAGLLLAGMSSAAAARTPAHGARTSASTAFLSGLDDLGTVASTIPANGDVNPYALIAAPVSVGRVVKGDVLVDNFNDKGNDQGTGSTIVEISPAGKVQLFAQIPRNLAGCPGGIGLTTAMTVLHDGWVVVGSTPSRDGTTRTAGAGCLVLLDPDGKVGGTIHASYLDGPWDLAAINGTTSSTLFVDNVLLGVGAPGQGKVDKGTVVRIQLSVAGSGRPRVVAEREIAAGLTEQASSGAFVIGPTGLVIENGTLYIADRVNNRILAIPDAATRTSSDSAPKTIASGGMLAGPLGMTSAPNGDLLVVNAQNGKVVEVTTAGRQLMSTWLDQDLAQQPAGSGDLFGITSDPNGRGLYFVKDDNNTLDLLH